MIPFTKYSNGNNIIHFAHANAYPSGCYQTFLEYLYRDYCVYAMDARPVWTTQSPDTLNNWKVFSEDIQDFFEEQNLHNVVGIGHSLGGITSLFAAADSRGHFSKLILLDPVVVEPSMYFIMNLPFMIKRKIIPMVKTALRRKNEWIDREEAAKYFKSKRLFQRFENKSFDDFITHGLKEESGKVVLAFPREWEARIYSTLTSVWHLLENPPCPIIVVKAQYSDVINDKVWSRWQKIGKNTTFIEMANVGHMMPLEKPRELANLLKGFLK